jgi:hypothetical protein
MTEMSQTDSRDRANGAFYPILHGTELRRVQRRLLASLLRQPGIVPIVMTTGIGPDDFPADWQNAFIVATKEPGRAKQIVADPNRDPIIRQLYMQAVLLGHGQARQMAQQIIASVRRREAAQHSTGIENLTNGDAEREHEQEGADAGGAKKAIGPGAITDDDDGYRDAAKDLVDNLSDDAAAENAAAGQDPRQGDRRTGAEQILPDESAPDRSVDADLAEMNSKYAVVRIGGKTRVVWFEEASAYPGCKVPVFSSIADFRAFHAKRKKVVIRNGKERKIGFGRWWIDHEQRRQFDGIVYAPSASTKITNGKLNLWSGFGCEPCKGKCDLYLAHLHANICAGNEEHAEYLVNWMASAVQYPDRQGEVAVALRGKEGTGKGVVAKSLWAIAGFSFSAHRPCQTFDRPFQRTFATMLGLVCRRGFFRR